MSSSLKVIILALIALLIVLIAPLVGGVAVDLREICNAITSESVSLNQDGMASVQILLALRIPRVLCAFLVGAALSVAGLILQTTFRTALATPFTLGTSAGAAFGAALMFVTVGQSSSASFMGAIIGSALVGVLVVTIIGLHRRVKISDVLLIGLTLSFFFSSLTTLLQYLAQPSEMMAINRWMSGQLTSPSYIELSILALTVIVVSGMLTAIARMLDMLSLGAEFVMTHGGSIRLVLLSVVASVAVLSGVSVTMAGPIAFAGILEPYLARALFGAEHRYLIPGTLLIGGSFMVLADLIARTIIFPVELPVSLLLGLIGLPFFIWIVFSGRSQD